MSAVQSDASPLFDDQDVLNIELAGPITRLEQTDRERREYEFNLRVGGVKFEIEVRRRGGSRIEECEFPPLRLDFRKRDTEGTLFAGQDKLKLVSHCHMSSRANRYVINEYAAYRIFNLLSDVGYRVRLLNINYIDTDAQRRNFSYYGFLIESMPELEERLNASQLGQPQVSPASLDTTHSAIVFTYQYMIGNTAWSLEADAGDELCCRNIDLIEIGGNRYAVPNDFDQSGLVNARYAVPDPELGIDRVTNRVYVGYCDPESALPDVLSDVRARRQDIVDLYAVLPGLSGDDKYRSVRYLRGFYNETENLQETLTRFSGSCR